MAEMDKEMIVEIEALRARIRYHLNISDRVASYILSDLFGESHDNAFDILTNVGSENEFYLEQLKLRCRKHLASLIASGKCDDHYLKTLMTFSDKERKGIIAFLKHRMKKDSDPENVEKARVTILSQPRTFIRVDFARGSFERLSGFRNHQKTHDVATVMIA